MTPLMVILGNECTTHFMADTMESTSISLLLRLKEPDNGEAWSRFVELYTPLIYYWARRTGMQPEDAADLVQDVLTQLIRKLPTFQYDGNKSFRGWLRSVTLNKWREQSRRRRVVAVEATDRELSNVTEPAADALFWEREYPQQLVARTVELLSSEFQPPTWQALRQYIFQGLTADQAAREAGISVWTVYAAKSRLLRRLRDELQGLLD